MLNKRHKKYFLGALALLVIAGALGLWQFWSNATPTAQAEPILEKTWNADTLVYPDGTNVSTFHGKWINYLDEDGWQSINTKFVETSEGFKMTNAPFTVTTPLRSVGEAVFHNNNRWDIFKNRKIKEPTLDMSIKALGVSDVTGRIEVGDLLLPAGLRKN